MRESHFQRVRREVKTPDLEERIEAAFSSVASTYQARPRVQHAPVGIETEALVGSLILAEGTCTVRLPLPTLQMAGSAIIIARDSSSGTVTVIPTAGTVSGGASTTITTGQARTFWCSGENWH